MTSFYMNYNTGLKMVKKDEKKYAQRLATQN